MTEKVYRVISRRTETLEWDIVGATSENDALRIFADYIGRTIGAGRPANIVSLQVLPEVTMEVTARLHTSQKPQEGSTAPDCEQGDTP